MARTDPGTLYAVPEDGSDYADIEITGALGDRLSALMDTDEAPETLGGIVRLHDETEAFLPEDFTWQDLFVTEDSRHVVRVPDDEYNTYCILDALILPFLLDEEVEIRSDPPGGEPPIQIRASPTELEARPASTVVSFGFSEAVPEASEALEADDPQGLQDLVHAEGCPKINAFPDADAYRAWAEEAEAATVGMTLAQAYAMARDSGPALRDER